MKRKVFYSFNFDNDVFRVQQIRNIGSIEGDFRATANQWEKLKKSSDIAIKRWINKSMEGKTCVIVLIGEETYKSEWVLYEIKKAWGDRRGLFGIYIHNLKCPKNGKSKKGKNPFELIRLKNGYKLSDYVKCHNPKRDDAYNDISNNIIDWIEDAIETRKRYL